MRAGKAAVVAGDQLRIERRLSLAPDRELDPASPGGHGLTAIAVARVAGALARHPDLAVGDLAGRACVLPAPTARGFAQFEKAGLDDHENRIG